MRCIAGKCDFPIILRDLGSKMMPMKKLILRIALNAFALYIVTLLMSGLYFGSTTALMATALILTVLNATVKPVLKLISLPITLMTFGLFSLVINGVVLLVAMRYGGGRVESLGTAVIAAIILSVINALLKDGDK